MTKANEALAHRRRGWWIRLARERKGMTLAAVAEALGYTEGQGTVSLWERGLRAVPSGKFPAIAAELDLSPRFLVNPPPTDEERLEAGGDVESEEPGVLTDGARRRRRKWWISVARITAGLGLDQARAAIATRGVRSELGNLVTLWENPREQAEPSEHELRVLADVYRVPVRAFIDLWNNPPATDEEAMADRRGVTIAEVEADEPAATTRPERRRRTA